MIHHSVQVITPEVAAKFLESNTANRPIRDRPLRKLISAIKNGEWKVNGEAIKFDVKGRLIDGQHRCMAVVKTGIPITSVVINGIGNDVFDTLDQGRTRQASDVLFIKGEKKNITQLASSARWYVTLTKGINKADVTIAMIEAVVNDVPHLKWWVSVFCTSKARSFMPASFASVLALASESHGQEMMEEFLNQVANGINLGQYSPALMLRERFLDRKRGIQFGPETMLAYCIKAVNAYTQGKQLKFLRWSMDEGMPKLV